MNYGWWFQLSYGLFFLSAFILAAMNLFDVFRRIRQQSRAAEERARQQGAYYDDRHCGHCGKVTLHRCTHGLHERDSSADVFVCMRCLWFSVGHGPQQSSESIAGAARLR